MTSIGQTTFINLFIQIGGIFNRCKKYIIIIKKLNEF